MKQQLDALVEFHQVFGAHIEETPTVDLPDEVIALRVSLIQEELNEYRHAAEARDLVAVADALSDLMYVVLGSYVSHGLQDAGRSAFRRSASQQHEQAGRQRPGHLPRRWQSAEVGTLESSKFGSSLGPRTGPE